MRIHIANVFVNDEGDFGNPVGIIVDIKLHINKETRQKIAGKLNFSETVFIDNLEGIPVISLFNPKHKVKFAGHAVLGTAYFIRNILKRNIDSIHCGGELVTITNNDNIMFISAPLSIMPSWNYRRLDSSAQVESLSKGQSFQMKHTFVWSWINKQEGLIRARTFASDWGIPEDEANGSGSMKLAVQLKKPIKIIHGKGSVIIAKPFGKGISQVGGRVIVARELNLSGIEK